MSRAEQAHAFCSALLGGPDGDDRLDGLYVTAWTAGDKKTRWRRADQPGAVASLVAELDADPQSQAVYISTTLTDASAFSEEALAARGPSERPRTKENIRPRAEDCAGLVALWVEIDISDEGHASAHLPKTEAQAQRILDAMRLRPTMVVHSGGGLHAWWVLTEPWLVRDAADPVAERAAMHQLVVEWIATAQYHAHRLGRWKVDSVTDLARLLRPAGTTNRKISGNPRAVRLLHLDPTATYNPSDFESVLPDPSVLSAYANPIRTPGGTANLTELEAQMVAEVNFAAVWARVNSPAYRVAKYTPEWIAEILEREAEVADGGKTLIADTWNGQRDDLKDDQNRYDAALIALLAAFPSVDTEGLVEALMCRRLRSGATTEKIDPRRRLDYITRTVAKFRVKAQRTVELKKREEDLIDQLANLRLETPPVRPVPDIPEDTPEEDEEQRFQELTQDLIEHEVPSDEEYEAVAQATIVLDLPEEPEEPEAPTFFRDDRPALEVECLDQLSTLLIPEKYRRAGVQVWALEVRDNGEQQKARMLLRLPVDFEWPVDRPNRYRPGQPLPTEWIRRDLFDSPVGFQKSLERDAKMLSEIKAPKEDWIACIRSLIPVWRRDSSGGDLASFAVEWLYSYLMERSGSMEINEVAAYGRAWVRATNGWRADKPPVIYVDMRPFLEYCSRQHGGGQLGRGLNGVLEYLNLTPRRPRVALPGVQAKRPTWYEVEAGQFDTSRWVAIIDVMRHACEVSKSKRGLRAVRDGEEGAVSLNGDRPRRGVR